ncbi:hypothetical protein CU097_009614 [Rhizopus azygosporus]|uniref:Uncharacterized protein n=1 Tax=Rhizopus azygosporus TaxID=86630 RepID=A0A367JDC4_RHIAZ|nr:hypothetical protein CU097_009614 [Rhizopus azygosporus]
MAILCMRGVIGSTLCFSKPNMMNDNQAEISSSIYAVFKDFVVLEFFLHTEIKPETRNKFSNSMLLYLNGWTLHGQALNKHGHILIPRVRGVSRFGHIGLNDHAKALVDAVD